MNNWGKILAFIVDGIKKLCDWLRKNKRRKNVQGMDKDIHNDNNASINKRVRDIKEQAKNRENSQ